MRKPRAKKRKRVYERASRAAPKTGWSLRELARLTGASERAIREYVQRGLVPRPPFKGPATRYERRQLLFVLAVRRANATEKLTLSAIRARLHALSADELERYATEALEPGPLAAALGVEPKPREMPAEPELAPRIAAHVPRWAHIALAVGLELHVSEDASDTVRELAKRLCDVAFAKA